MTSSSSPAVLPDIATEGERLVRETYRPVGEGYLWTDVVGVVQTAIAEERARHTLPIEDLGSSPKTAIPAPADGQVASQREAIEDWFSRWLVVFANRVQYVTLSTRAVRLRDLVAEARPELDKLLSSPTDQSSDVSGLVEEAAASLAGNDGHWPWRALTEAAKNEYRAKAQALAQAKRDGGKG